MEKLCVCSEYSTIASEALGDRTSIACEQNVFVIQPYIKWGPNKSPIPPDVKLQETEDLIRSLDTWNLVKSIKVPLVGIKKTFFGKGKMDELRSMSKGLASDTSKKVNILLGKFENIHFNVISISYQTDHLRICECRSTRSSPKKLFRI